MSEYVRLGDVFSVIRNGANIKQLSTNSGYPITRIETISDRTINREKMGYADIIDISKYKDYVLEDGDILMSHINSEKHLGKVAIYKKENDEMIIHGMNLLMLRANKKLLLPHYAKYFFESNIFLSQIATITKKSVNQASFTVSALKELDILCPDLYMQNDVVAKLDKVTALIDKHKKQLEKLDELVKARFVEMFGDPVSNPKKFSQLKLFELGELGRGVSKHRPRNAPELLGGKYPLIQTGDVANSRLYITKYENTYSDLGFKQSKLWNKGTLCITIAANIAKTSILEFDACFPDSVVGFIANDKTNNIFIHYWFSFFQKILESQAPESAQKNINLKVLNELMVIVPNKILQNKFADFVKQVEKTKTEVQKKLEQAEILKKALMQKYFG